MKFGILFLLIIAGSISARVRPVYDFQDSSFSLEYRFDITNTNVKELLAILFEYEHVHEYSSKTNVKITPIEEDATTNILLFEYNYLIAKLGVTMLRELLCKGQTVRFAMQNYVRTSKIIPDVLSVSGSYEICGSTIIYRQETILNQKINRIYAHLIKRDVRNYLKKVIAYIDEYPRMSNDCARNEMSNE